jgi:hypothetical protein
MAAEEVLLKVGSRFLAAVLPAQYLGEGIRNVA